MDIYATLICSLLVTVVVLITYPETTSAKPQEVVAVPANPDKKANGICSPTDHNPSTSEPSSSCVTDSDCSASDENTKCDRIQEICVPTNLSLTAPISNNCGSDADCETSYRCHREKCHFTGPKPCQDDRDCLRGMSFGMDQQCRDVSNSTTDERFYGTRCWLKCATDEDCHECSSNGQCRMPENQRRTLRCDVSPDA